MLTASLSLVLGALGALSSDPVAKKGDEFGSITGRVVFEGEKPAPKPDIEIKPEAATGCKHADAMDKKDDTLLIDDKGGVANVVLTITAAGVERKVPTEPIEFDQEGCRFHPHVAVVPLGATLRFANSDDTNHNIHTYAKKNAAVNKNVGAAGNFDQVLDKAEVIEIKCDIHTWMKGYVVVTDATHFATTAADGSFTIAGLPAGEYEVSWWHEELGKGKSEKIKVEAGKASTLEQKVSAEKKGGGGRRR